MICRITAVLCALALSACSTPPTTITKTETLEVPVVVRCTTEGVKKPAPWAMDTLPIGASVYAQLSAALEEIEQRIEYEAELVGAVLACSAEPRI